jgi:hypothetical protein
MVPESPEVLMLTNRTESAKLGATLRRTILRYLSSDDWFRARVETTILLFLLGCFNIGIKGLSKIQELLRKIDEPPLACIPFSFSP